MALTKLQERFCQELKKETHPITMQKRIAAFKRCGFREKKPPAIKKKVKELMNSHEVSSRVRELREQKRGRPTDYRPEYCDDLIAFFDQEPYEVVMVKNEKGEDVIATQKNGAPILKPCQLPTKEAFAKSIGVHTNTLLSWSSKHQDFMCAIQRAENIQKNILIQNGLFGNYESKFAQFVAKNVTDMKDQQEVVSRTLTAEIPADAKPEDAAKMYQDMMDS